MTGPLLIFDKSFVQMLSPDELFELNLAFFPVSTPTLIREIIADLKKEPSGKRLPKDIVKALAGKMWSAHGVQPANFRKLALANLCGTKVPMFGQVPVDSSAPNVQLMDGGQGLLYDATPEQRMWERWASGNFTTHDEDVADAWRSSIQRVNLRATGDEWKQFAAQHFCQAKNISELVIGVDALIGNPKAESQLELLQILLDFLRAPDAMRNFAFTVLLERRILLRDLSPYATSILRLYLTFVGGLGRGFIGPRPSHYIDLQYLFYAPFCMAFASADKFHRTLWPAASGINSFVWGQDLKSDLAKRAKMRAEGNRTYDGIYPVELEGSVLSEIWRKYMLLKPKQSTLRTGPRTIEDLDPQTRDRIKRAMQEFDKL